MRLVVIEPRDPAAPTSARPAVEVGMAPVLIGRGTECDLALEDEKLSRHHVEVRCEGQRVHVRDLGSRNGTYINGRRVTDGWVLVGDELRVGRHVLRLQPAGSPGDAPPTLATDMPGPVISVTASGAALAGADTATGRHLRRPVAVALGLILAGTIAAKVPLLRTSERPPAPAQTTDPLSALPPFHAALRELMDRNRDAARRRLAEAPGPAAAAFRAWLAAGGGLAPDRPGAGGELIPLTSLLAAADLPPELAEGFRARRDRIALEVEAAEAGAAAQAFERDGRLEDAIGAYEALDRFPGTGATARLRPRAATLRAALVRRFRELGQSNRAVEDWDGAARCFRTARRWAGDAQAARIDVELAQAERELAARSTLEQARALAAAGEWEAARAALAAAPAETTLTRRITALRVEIDRRQAMARARALYAAGEAELARTHLEPWRAEGDVEASALWRRAGETLEAWTAAERALGELRYEDARAAWARVLETEADPANAFHRRATQRLTAWPVERVAATLRGAALRAIDRGRYTEGRDLLERGRLVHAPGVERDIAELLLRAEVLFNEALNLRRTDPSAARDKYQDALAMQRPGDPKYEATLRELAKLGR